MIGANGRDRDVVGSRKDYVGVPPWVEPWRRWVDETGRHEALDAVGRDPFVVVELVGFHRRAQHSEVGANLTAEGRGSVHPSGEQQQRQASGDRRTKAHSNQNACAPDRIPRQRLVSQGARWRMITFRAPCSYVENDILWGMSPRHKPLVWLSGEVKTPPFSADARLETGYLLRLLQAGLVLVMPHSRPMPVIGVRCHELRIHDETRIWRIIYRVDPDAVVIVDVFSKTTQATPATVIKNSQRRLRAYDDAVKG